MRTHSEIQREYKARKIQAGYKRVQIWKLDKANKQVQQKIKKACFTIAQSNDKEVDQETYKYYDQILHDIPL